VERGRLHVIESPPRRALAPTGGFLRAFTHTLNPYGGCGFGAVGCPFCYVRQSPSQRFAPKDARGERRAWGSWLRVKTGLAERLARELGPQRARSYRVYMGSVTDPYQGAEARYRLSRGCLQALRDRPVAHLTVQTRSVLVERDLDVLRDMPFARLHISVETDSVEVHRAFTRSSPPPARRLATARRARDAGVPVTVTVSPLLPVTDPETFAAAIAGAADAVVVDTLLLGDGAGGSRSRRNGMQERLAAAGYAGFMDDPAPLGTLLEALRRHFPENRVGVSAEGFNAEAARNAAPPAGPATSSTCPGWPGTRRAR
jgi:DNA repair photolyase